MSDREHTKFDRIFAQLEEVRLDIAKIKVREDSEQKQLDDLGVKLDEVRIQLASIVGKESVRATISGVIGAVVSGVAVWLIQIAREAAR